MRLATGLTSRKIEDSLASPESMSFWELPGYHLAAGAVRLFGAAPSAAIQCPVGASRFCFARWCWSRHRSACACSGAAARCVADERRRRRIPAVFPLGRRLRSGALGENPGFAGRLDPGRRQHDFRRLDAASPRRRMTLGFRGVRHSDRHIVQSAFVANVAFPRLMRRMARFPQTYRTTSGARA